MNRNHTLVIRDLALLQNPESRAEAIQVAHLAQCFIKLSQTAGSRVLANSQPRDDEANKMRLGYAPLGNLLLSSNTFKSI